MLRANKARIYPSSEQRQILAFQFGAVRWAYNFALDWRSRSWKENGEHVSRHQMLVKLSSLKNSEETAWLKQADMSFLVSSDFCWFLYFSLCF